MPAFKDTWIARFGVRLLWDEAFAMRMLKGVLLGAGALMLAYPEDFVNVPRWVVIVVMGGSSLLKGHGGEVKLEPKPEVKS